MYKSITLKVIGLRPEDIPDGWLIFNAPRPLDGHKLWIDEWFNGSNYAAVDPNAPLAERMIQANYENLATRIEYVLPEMALTEQVEWYRQMSPELAESLDLNDIETRQKVLAGWHSRQHLTYERAVAEAA